MSDLMMRLSELTRDLFAVGSEEDGRTAAEADARIREQRDLLEECEQALDAALPWIDTYEAAGYEAYGKAKAVLARLRAQEKADE